MSIFQQTEQALGTEIVLTIACQTSDQAQEAFSGLWELIHQFDSSFSRFLPDSELSRFNIRAGQKVQVSPEFGNLLAVSKEMALETKGVFNPFVLPALQRAGYVHSWLDINKRGPDFTHRRVARADELYIVGQMAEIPADSALDSGGAGKGYLLDLLAKQVRKQGVKNYWFSLGGDIIAAGRLDSDSFWEIDIADIKMPNEAVAMVSVPADRTIAVATSAITKRRGVHQGKKWHHIIDPGTGESAKTDILAATVCAPRGVVADVYASCIVALGTAGYEQFMREHDIKDLMVQTKDEVIIHGSLIRRVYADRLR